MSEAIDFFVAHQGAIGGTVAAICIGLKVWILYHCPSHPLYRGPKVDSQ